MRATDFITELFRPGKDWKWSFTGSEEAVAVFHVGDIPYMFHAYGTDGVWEVEFKRHGAKLDRSTKFGLTGTGNSAEVMSTIVDIMRGFLTKYQGKIETLTFSAKEDSRQSLYAKMAKRLLPDWTLQQNGGDFLLVSPHTDLEEGWKEKLGAAALGSALTLGGMSAKNFLDQPSQQVQQPQSVTQVQTAQPTKQEFLTSMAKKVGMEGQELMQFIAQAAHETANFTKMAEAGTSQYFAKKYDPKYNPRKAKILGNKHVGDGEMFKGRGYLHLTGRDNYTRASRALYGDDRLVKNPDLVSTDPKIAAETAIWYWQNRVAPKVSDFGNVKQVTKKINPGMKGMKSRVEKFNNIAATQGKNTGQRPT